MVLFMARAARGPGHDNYTVYLKLHIAHIEELLLKAW